MLEHTHYYFHTHPKAREAKPPITQTVVQFAKLEALRDNLQACLSRRVFVTGGGFAPGQNGEDLV